MKIAVVGSSRADRLSISACGHKTKTDRRKKMQKMSAAALSAARDPVSNNGTGEHVETILTRFFTMIFRLAFVLNLFNFIYFTITYD